MGGTDLLVRVRDGALCPHTVVDVKGLDGMQDVIYDPCRGLGVGAAVTMNQLARHPEVQAHYPLLAEAARSVASYQLRNRATVGGNLCNASPCADTALAALAHVGFLLGVDHEHGLGRGIDYLDDRAAIGVKFHAHAAIADIDPAVLLILLWGGLGEFCGKFATISGKSSQGGE